MADFQPGTSQSGPKRLGPGRQPTPQPTEGPQRPTYDRSRFVSLEAQQKYQKKLGKKKMLEERGINYESFSFSSYFDHEGWQKLAGDPGPAWEFLTHELYANGFSEDPQRVGQVWLRSRWLTFTADSINEYFGVRRFQDGEYDDYYTILETVDHKDVAEAITIPDTEWHYTVNNARQLHHPRLKSECQALYKFLLHRLIPASHVSHITWDRGVLLYCIMTHRTVNVGRVIVDKMKKVMKVRTKNNYGFPSLIIGMCVNCGIRKFPGEPSKDPMKLIENDERSENQGPPQEAQRRRGERTPSMNERMTQYMDENRAWMGRMEARVEDQGARLERLEITQQQMHYWMSQHYGGNVPPSG